MGICEEDSPIGLGFKRLIVVNDFGQSALNFVDGEVCPHLTRPKLKGAVGSFSRTPGGLSNVFLKIKLKASV